MSLNSILNSFLLLITTLPAWIKPKRLPTKLLRFICCAVIILRPLCLKLTCITLRAPLSINIDGSITIISRLDKLQKRIKPFCPSVSLLLHFFILFTHLTSNNARFPQITISRDHQFSYIGWVLVFAKLMYSFVNIHRVYRHQQTHLIDSNDVKRECSPKTATSILHYGTVKIIMH